jgi:hypothetical protein
MQSSARWILPLCRTECGPEQRASVRRAPDPVTTIREYDRTNGRFVRVLAPDLPTTFRKPRGLRFGRDSRFYCVTENEVVAFDFATGKCLGAVARLPGLNGHAVIFFG